MRTLKELGASEAEATEACATIYDRVTSDHIRAILGALRDANPQANELFRELADWKMDEWDEKKILKFIKENSLREDPETKERLLDLDYFHKHRMLRREDKWQS